MRNSAFCIPPSALGSWLPDMDLNHDKQIQSLLCYRYTIGQAGASVRLTAFGCQSSYVPAHVALPLAIRRFNDSTVQRN